MSDDTARIAELEADLVKAERGRIAARGRAQRLEGLRRDDARVLRILRRQAAYLLRFQEATRKLALARAPGVFEALKAEARLLTEQAEEE